MHVYQMRSSNSAVVQVTEQRMQACMTALKEVSKVWLVAKMVHTLFESILGNKVLEERLQKAAGNRHKKRPTVKTQVTPSFDQTSVKRKFDDIDTSFTNAPAPQMSYERSRPQTPAITPSRELPPPHPGMPTMTANPPSPEMPRHDAFMGNSRNTTRPTSPFLGPGQSYPGTPPDLFLITRNSPNIPQDLWSNFQPDQLFPPDSNIFMPPQSPRLNNNMIDPQLAGHAPPLMQSPPMHTSQAQPGQQMNYGPASHHLQPPNGGLPPHMQSPQQNNPNSWAQVGAMNQRSQQMGNEDTLSNSSMSQGPNIPTTLNVEDW